MATYNYSDLKTKYKGFLRPVTTVIIDGQNFSDNEHHFVISDLEIENTSDFEASIASFVIYNSFNKQGSRFLFKELKEYILLGSPVVIYMGYDKSAREVFRGFIAKVNFEAPKLGTPGVRITAMDVKGLMMSGSYAKQLLANNYGDAVKEVLNRTNYKKINKEGSSAIPGTGSSAFGGLANAANTINDAAGAIGMEQLDQTSIITKITVEPTPDKKEDAGGMGAMGDAFGGMGASGEEKASAYTIEMVNESDYEFVVKAAKKYNFEFFSIGGHVHFRPAKSDSEILMVLGPETGMRSMDAQYDITGLVGNVEVRGIDVSKGQLIKSSKKLNNKISTGSKAIELVDEIQHIVIDPTIESTSDAGSRASFLAEDISYRFGTLQAEFTGIPELVPGKFIILSVLGLDMNVKFYVTTVIHRMDTDNGYTTKIIAKASSIEATKES